MYLTPDLDQIELLMAPIRCEFVTKLKTRKVLIDRNVGDIDCDELPPSKWIMRLTKQRCLS